MASDLACVVGLSCWWQAAPGLWVLATFPITGPIRPMALVAALLVGAFAGGLVGMPLSACALKLSKRPTAQTASWLGMLAAVLPVVNFLLFWVIVVIRGIELAS